MGFGAVCRCVLHIDSLDVQSRVYGGPPGVLGLRGDELLNEKNDDALVGCGPNLDFVPLLEHHGALGTD